MEQPKTQLFEYIKKHTFHRVTAKNTCPTSSATSDIKLSCTGIRSGKNLCQFMCCMVLGILAGLGKCCGCVMGFRDESWLLEFPQSYPVLAGGISLSVGGLLEGICELFFDAL